MPTGLRHRFFVWWAGVITRFPVPILLVTTLLGVASVIYAREKWSFQPDRNLLISDKLAWNKRFIDTEALLPGSHNMEVVVDAGPQAATKGSEAYRAARALVDDLGPRLQASPYVTHVVWGFPESQANPKAVRILPMKEFEAQVDKMRQAGPLLASPTPQAMLGQIQSQMLARFTQGLGELFGGLFGGHGAAAAAKPTSPEEDAKTAADIGDLNHLLEAFAAYLQTPAKSAGAIDFGALATPGEEGPNAWQYLPSDNGRLLFIIVAPKEDQTRLDPLEVTLKEVRTLVADAVRRHPGVEAGVTGGEVLDADETQVATWDSTWTAIVATILITALLVLAFHSWRTPVLAVIALLYGVAWTYGFLFLSVGHLQILSVVFNVMLLGLGIAYGIYLASAFELLRHDYPDDLDGFRQTLARTFEMMGPGIFTGSLTTAAAFATTIFTDFTGVAEMGLIAGAGILLCLAAMFTVFPVFLRLFKPTHAHITPMEDRYVVFFRPAWAMPFVRHPVVTLAVAAVLTAASVAVIVTQVRFDFDLLSLQPRNTPGVVWMQRIMRDGHEDRIWSNMAVVPTIEEGRRLSREFRALPTVADVGGIGMLFPADEAEKLKTLAQVRAELGPALGRAAFNPAGGVTITASSQPAVSQTAGSNPALPSAGPDLLEQLGVLGLALRSAAGMKDTPAPIKAAMAGVGATLARINQAVAGLSTQERAQRVAALVRGYQRWREQSIHQIAAALDPSPLTFDDLPAAIMSDYRDTRGHYILEVYPKLPTDAHPPITSPLDPRFLPRFVRDTQRVDPEITGIMSQIYWSGDLIENAYINAGYVALTLVLLIVLLDYGGWYHVLVAIPLAVNVMFLHYPYSQAVSVGLFALMLGVFLGLPSLRRGLHDALLILLPVAMAFATTFGVMWLVGTQVNAANIIVLPLMFGIGVDSGVHVLNRYRQDPHGEPVGLTQGTGKGITITCLTSVIGFGVMVLSRDRGIASLGFVLTLGLTMTMIACWTVMPAWLELRNRWRHSNGVTPG